MREPHIFAGNTLDRGEALRRDADRLARLVEDPTSRFLPMAQLNPLVSGERDLHLGWISSEEIGRLDVEQPAVLLGLEGDTAYFAIDISELGDPMHELGLDEPWHFEDSRNAATHLPISESGILAQARAQLGWHRSHAFCSVCGERSVMARGGQVRRCDSCGAEHFPRTDPVAIMVVTDGERCLLGQSRGRLASTGMYSALAGFIDQGEAIEEAVRREVMEEAGIEVGEVRYHSSQPWPFPSSLMIGCHAEALTTDIHFDAEEMNDVSWFTRDDIHRALRGEHESLRVPGRIAIAHHLIRAWVEGDTL